MENGMSEVINRLLSKLDLHPILVDIGAAGAPPQIWEKIARHSIYVGFDPDLREIHEVTDGRFYKALVINKAITCDGEANEVLFYYTRSPHCSSTLKPAAESLANFLFSDLFVVESEAMVQAASLDSIIDGLSLPGIDWFKTDSQGTDLRLFNSLNEKIRARVLAVDIEPGLIDAYVGEDLFVDAHRELTRQGFWLSNLDVKGSVRMRRVTLRKIMAANRDIDERLIERTVKKSPGWCEARYLRTLEWVAQCNFGQLEYVLLLVFALLYKQLGFALDLAMEYERLFGRDEVLQVMQTEPISRIRRSRHLAMARRGILRLSKLFT